MARAKLLFDDSKRVNLALTRRDALVVGVILTGISLGATHLWSIAKAVEMAVYYSEGWRQALFSSAFEGSGKDLVEGGVACLTGLALAKWASSLAAWLDPQGSELPAGRGRSIGASTRR